MIICRKAGTTRLPTPSGTRLEAEEVHRIRTGSGGRKGRRIVEQGRRMMTIMQDNRTYCGQSIVDPGHVSPVPLTRGSEGSLPVKLKVNDRKLSYPKCPSTEFKLPSLLSLQFCSIESIRAVTNGGSTRCQGFICIISLDPYRHPRQGHYNPIFILFRVVQISSH